MRNSPHERLLAFIREAAGEPAVRVAKVLLEKGEATDTEISETLGERPSFVRKALYDLYEARVADYSKEKDRETGWLTFHWFLTPSHLEEAIVARKRREILRLERELERETSTEFFRCPRGRERFDFDAAAEFDFRCPEHGDLLDREENAERIERMQRRLEELRKEGLL